MRMESRVGTIKWGKTLLGLIGALALILFNFCSTASAADRRESTEISDYIKLKHGYELDIFSIAEPWHTKVTMYGVLDEEQQSEIIELLKEGSKRRRWSPIFIRFKVEQVWHKTEYEGGGSISRRGKGVVLREEWIMNNLVWW